MSILEPLQSVLDEACALLLFDLIAKDLYQHGYSVQTNALPAELAALLAAEVRPLPADHFKKSGYWARSTAYTQAVAAWRSH